VTDLLAFTAELVDIPSVSHNEGAITDHLEGLLRVVPWLDVERVGENLVARATGTGPRLLLAGHTDTVPPNDNERARLDGEVLWGLGSADMKSGVAVLAELARTVERAAVPVTYVFYECEEVAARYNGIERLFRERPDLLEADAAILAEPTGALVEAARAHARAHRARPARRRTHRAGRASSRARRCGSGRPTAAHRRGRSASVRMSVLAAPSLEVNSFHESTPSHSDPPSRARSPYRPDPKRSRLPPRRCNESSGKVAPGSPFCVSARPWPQICAAEVAEDRENTALVVDVGWSASTQLAGCVRGVLLALAAVIVLRLSAASRRSSVRP